MSFLEEITASKKKVIAKDWEKHLVGFTEIEPLLFVKRCDPVLICVSLFLNKEHTKYQPVGFVHALTDNLDFIGSSFKHEFKPYISKHKKNFEISFERHQAEINDLFGISKLDIKFFLNDFYTFSDILNEASDWYIDRNRRGPKFQPKAIEKLISIACPICT